MKPQAFTVGGHFDGKTVTGGVTYARTWANGWGATAYAKAWWSDQPVTVSAGVEVTKKW